MSNLGLSETAIYAHSKLTEYQQLQVKKRLLYHIRMMSLQNGTELPLDMEIREVELMIEKGEPNE